MNYRVNKLLKTCEKQKNQNEWNSKKENFRHTNDLFSKVLKKIRQLIYDRICIRDVMNTLD